MAKGPLTADLAQLVDTANSSSDEPINAARLIQLLQAQAATRQAAHAIEQVADELRRYQKFVRPGPPSPHIVQLRRQQAAARQAASLSRQSFIKAAAAFVRAAGLAVPPRVPLEAFITGWIEVNVPAGCARR